MAVGWKSGQRVGGKDTARWVVAAASECAKGDTSVVPESSLSWDEHQGASWDNVRAAREGGNMGCTSVQRRPWEPRDERRLIGRTKSGCGVVSRRGDRRRFD